MPMHIDRSRVGITWATFGHLYSDYYVHQFTTGISGAHLLANRGLSGQAGAVEGYLEFLKAGSSLYPLEALCRGGFDQPETGGRNVWGTCPVCGPVGEPAALRWLVIRFPKIPQ